MITKAIVERLPENGSAKFLIRIPIFDGFEGSKEDTDYNSLTEATLCCLPGVSNPVNVGDIVYVGFEDNNIARPVILGHLYLGDSPNASKTSIGLNLNSLTVSDQKYSESGSAKLPVGTSIGNLSYDDLLKIKAFYDSFPEDFNLANSPWFIEK